MSFEETEDRFTAKTQVASWLFGLVAAAFLIFGWVEVGRSLWKAAVDADGVAALNAVLFAACTTGFVGFIGAMALGRQRVSLDQNRLETAWLILGAPLCRWRLPFDSIRQIDSVREEAADDEHHIRLRIRTTDDVVHVWSVVADNLAAEELAKRLAKFRTRLRRG